MLANWELSVDERNLLLCMYKLCVFVILYFAPSTHWRSKIQSNSILDLVLTFSFPSLLHSKAKHSLFKSIHLKQIPNFYCKTAEPVYRLKRFTYIYKPNEDAN